MTTLNFNQKKKEKILLVMLPFWTSSIPPLGISCIKSFLQRHGYDVKTVDANVESELRTIYDLYVATLKRQVPEENRGNFYNISHDVLRNHLMAHMNYTDMYEYQELIRLLIHNIFFCPVPNKLIEDLIPIADTFFEVLRDYLVELFEREKPSVLGLSVFKGNVPASLFAFQVAKQTCPGIKTVMGGGVFDDQLALNSRELETFLEKAPFIDHAIDGEGELLFLKLLKGELPENKRVYTRKDLDNQVLDLSTSSIPDFSDLNLIHYPNLSAYTSRSCPFQCGFCSETVRWGPYRRKKSLHIADELTQLYKKHGHQVFQLGDSLLNPVITDLSQELIRRDASLYWDGYLRTDKPVCDPDNTILWRQGGFYRARVGVESGSQRVLDLMNKKLTPEQIKTAVSSLAQAGIKTTTMWVVGYPGETESDFQATLNLIEECCDDIYEAEGNAFWYFPRGQIRSEKWTKIHYLLYPETANDMLIIPTYDLKCEPARKERYARMCRFVEHCRRLGVPNPYSLQDIYEADNRWKMLHKNAVPSLVEFKQNQVTIDENKQVKKISFLKIKPREIGDFDF